MPLFPPSPDSFSLSDRPIDASAAIGMMEHFFMATSSPLAVLGLDGCLKQVNGAFRNLFGDSASAIGQSWFEFLHPDDRATVQAQWQTFIQHQSAGRIEAQMVSPQGGGRWFAWQLDRVGDRQWVYAVGQDISEYRRQEVELRQREERWLLALRGSNDGVWDWNIETNEVYFSPRWKSMLGFEEHEIANDFNEWAKRVHPDDLERVVLVVQDHFARKIPFYITEHRVCCKDGSYKWILDRGQAIWDETGRAIRMVGYHTDIDERKALEAALQEANQQLEQRVAERTAQLEQANAALTEREALYRTLSQHIPNGAVLLFDRSLRYLLVEGDELKQVGLDRNQMVGKTLGEVFPPEVSRAIEPYYQAALAGQSLMYEIPFQQQVYEAHTVPVRNDQGEIFAGMVLTQNITDRSRSETLLATQNYILEMITTGASLSEILETLAHLIETQSAEAICSILLLDEADHRLHLATCSSLTNNLSSNLTEGLPINPTDTICGTAAYTRQTVIVPDIDAEPRWAKGAALLRQYDLKACWSTPILDSQGKVLGTFALYYRTPRLPNTAEQRLITIASHLAGVAIERQRSGAALKQREDQLRLITETIPQQVWTATPDGQVDYYNQRWCEFTGKTLEQLKNDGWAEIVHPDDLEQVGQRWAASIQNGSEYQAEARLRAANGEYRWILGQARPLRNTQGQIVKWYGTNTDITEQKQAETALQESEQRLQAILNQSEAVIYLKDPQGRYLLVNRQYELLAQKTQTALPVKAQLAGNSAGNPAENSAGLKPETADLFCSPDLDVLETGLPLTYEERLYLPNGVRTYLSVKFPLLSADGVPYAVCSISTDITDRKQIELERERYAEQSYRLLQQEQAARAQAEQANRIKDEFLAVLSHELRTPLNPILGWSKLLQSRQLSPEKVQQGLETIERNVKLQTQLIDDLLDISRILRGKLVLDMAPVDLSQPIAAALETVRLSADAKGVDLSTQLDAPLRQVYGDASRLQQVMWNLLSNAIKFTSEGGSVRVKVEQVYQGRRKPSFFYHLIDPPIYRLIHPSTHSPRQNLPHSLHQNPGHRHRKGHHVSIFAPRVRAFSAAG